MFTTYYAPKYGTSATRGQYLLVITDLLSEFTNTVPMKRISAAELGQHFVGYFVSDYDLLAELIKANGGFFQSKFFTYACIMMSINNHFTTKCNRKSNEKVKIKIKLILAALKSYVVGHAQGWNLQTDVLTYAKNFQPPTLTIIAPFELV